MFTVEYTEYNSGEPIPNLLGKKVRKTTNKQAQTKITSAQQLY